MILRIPTSSIKFFLSNKRIFWILVSFTLNISSDRLELLPCVDPAGFIISFYTVNAKTVMLINFLFVHLSCIMAKSVYGKRQICCWLPR